MKTTFKITNHTTELVSEDQELIGVGFANHGSFAVLNNCSLDYDTLTTDQQTLVDQFLDLMRTKMFSCSDDGGDGSDGSGRES